MIEIEIDEVEEENLLMYSEVVDEFFVIIYDSFREINVNCIIKICDLIGKFIESFIMFICRILDFEIN